MLNFALLTLSTSKEALTFYLCISIIIYLLITQASDTNSQASPSQLASLTHTNQVQV